MQDADIDFSNGWQIERIEHIRECRAVVKFGEPLDLKRLMALRRAYPSLQTRAMSDLVSSLRGTTEFDLGDVPPEQIDGLRSRFENEGFAVEVSSKVQVIERPVFVGRRPTSFDIKDPDARVELLDHLKKLGVPSVSRPAVMRTPVHGDRAAVIEYLQKWLTPPKPSTPKKIELPPWVERDPPRFKYIDESILQHYASPGSCCGCGREAYVFILMRDLIIDGEEVEVDEVCESCLRDHEITEYDATRTRNHIGQMVNAHHGKGNLSKVERRLKVENIFSEFMATPKLPNFVQRIDWPTCCGDFTRFIGDAGSSYRGPYDGFEWWGSENDVAVGYGIEGMIGVEDPVSLFACLSCTRKFWTYQTT